MTRIKSQRKLKDLYHALAEERRSSNFPCCNHCAILSQGRVTEASYVSIFVTVIAPAVSSSHCSFTVCLALLPMVVELHIQHCLYCSGGLLDSHGCDPLKVLHLLTLLLHQSPVPRRLLVVPTFVVCPVQLTTANASHQLPRSCPRPSAQSSYPHKTSPISKSIYAILHPWSSGCAHCSSAPPWL